MYKGIKKVNANNLLYGMRLAKEITVNGVKLLDKDTVLNNKYISKIRTIDPFLEISVYCELEETDYFIQKSIEKLNEKERTFEGISNKLENVYNNIEYNQKLNITELRAIQKDILLESKDYGATMRSIVNGREINKYLYRHCINVCILSNMLGKWLNMSEETLHNLTYAALLHDIGKLKIDNKILSKKSKLTVSEFKSIKTHAAIGYNIVKNIPYMDKSVAMGVLMHHERCDGSGYPLKLKEDKIHEFGKIIAIIDMFDALTSNREYRKKLPIFKALEKIKEESLRRLDFNYFTAFAEGIINCCIGEMVKLNNGKIGKIVSLDINNISKPLLMIDSDFVDLKSDDSLYIEELI